MDSRKGEVEFWVKERQTLRDRIDSLEAEHMRRAPSQKTLTANVPSTVRRKEPRLTSAERQEKRMRKKAKKEKQARIDAELQQKREEVIRLREEIARLLG